ncbi:MAG: ribulose 1,5-bisphosphate synthetase/thiazole synthase [Crocinitomix sp.]|jgi:ribulose 1,5-bisphosphate synthetase/thiazole synthase
MKSLVAIISVSLILFSCGSEHRENYTSLDEDGKIVISEESTKILEEIQASYDACKADESEARECNRFTSEALCRFYQIEDFKKGEEYVTYREIKDVVTKNGGTWELIGVATNQEDLDKAQKNANDTKATIAFDPTKTNHVAIILPGSTTKSNQWGMNVPNSASFFVHKADSYINKGLSYSFTGPEGIILYTKK